MSRKALRSQDRSRYQPWSRPFLYRRQSPHQPRNLGHDARSSVGCSIYRYGLSTGRGLSVGLGASHPTNQWTFGHDFRWHSGLSTGHGIGLGQVHFCIGACLSHIQLLFRAPGHMDVPVDNRMLGFVTKNLTGDDEERSVSRRTLKRQSPLLVEGCQP